METNSFELPQPENDSLSFKRYLSLFISNWYWFAITVLIAVSIAYAINRYSQEVYSASSTLLIKDDFSAGLNRNPEAVIPGGDIFKNQQKLVNEMGILKSFSLNYRVIRKLKDFHVTYVAIGRRNIVEKLLYNDCPFMVVCDSTDNQPKVRVDIEILSDQQYTLNLGSGIPRVLKFGELFTDYGFRIRLIKRNNDIPIYEKNRSNKYYFYFSDPGAIANQYSSKLSVTPIAKDASIVNLSVTGNVPEQEEDYLNTLMKEYLNYGLEIKNATADSTIRFIDQQIMIIANSVEEAESKLESFRKSNRIFDISREATAIQNKLQSLDNERATFELQMQYYKYLNSYLKGKNQGDVLISPSVMGISDQNLIRLVNDLSVIKTEKNKLNFNLADNQPALKLMDQQADETKSALLENVRTGIYSLEQAITESDRKISEINGSLYRLPTTERNFLTIQRKFDLDNTVYTYLLEKRAESGIARASNLPDNRIIDYAKISGPIKPRKRNNYSVAFVIGIIIPMFGIWLIDFLNDKVIDKKDIATKTRVPVIGYINHYDGLNEMSVVDSPASSLSESFRSVRTNLKYYIKEDQTPVISISSTISSEGKTYISMNLAAITAMTGKKVLLVGLDLRKPRIDKVFKLEESAGLSTYLTGRCEFEDVIMKTEISNLFYAPSGPVPPNPAELLERNRIQEFITKAKSEFDFIFIDTPPVAIVTDALLLSKIVDINLFIVRQRYTSRNTLEIIEQLYSRGELKNMAIIMNDISLTGYYGYGLRYGYYSVYGYNYGNSYYNRGYYGKSKVADYYSES